VLNSPSRRFDWMQKKGFILVFSALNVTTLKATDFTVGRKLADLISMAKSLTLKRTLKIFVYTYLPKHSSFQ
jgi:hypothetical protein